MNQSESRNSRVLVNRVLQLLIDTVESDDTLVAQFKAKFIHPIYSQMYPYFVIVVVLISLALVINLISCMFMVMVSYRHR